LEARVEAAHPLRPTREIANIALTALSGEFEALYSGLGRPSIPPEKLLRAMLLQALYSVRSERQLMERIKFDLLFRWFVGLGMDDPVWDHSSSSTNRDRLLDGEIATKFLAAALSQPRVKRLLSSQHFSVDGTLIEAWASLKSFKPKDHPSDGGDDPSGGGRNRSADFHGKKRSNETHAAPPIPTPSGALEKWTGPSPLPPLPTISWDREYLDLAGPAYLHIGAEGWAVFSFGAVDATAELEYGRRIILFDWSGFDEGDASGGGSAELQDDGSLEIELSFDDGDDAILTAHRETTYSTACKASTAI
jgi:transposase